MEKFQGTRRRNGKAKTVSFVVLNIVQSTVQKRYLITTVRTYFRSETQTLYPGLFDTTLSCLFTALPLTI